MTLHETIEQYILWRQAHGAKFTTGRNLLLQFLGYADGNAACDEATTAQVLAFLAGKGPLTRHRENKYYALAGFLRLLRVQWQAPLPVRTGSRRGLYPHFLLPPAAQNQVSPSTTVRRKHRTPRLRRPYPAKSHRGLVHLQRDRGQ